VLVKTIKPKETPQMNHTQHPYMEEQAKRLNRRADSTLDFLTAIAIGIGFAVLLASWWSS
jgi:hypothetical protein